MVNFTAIYVLWLREMKRTIRNKSQLIGNLIMPLFFLASFGMGFSKASVPGVEGTDYIQFLVPGIIGMGLLFRSTFAGLSLLWDKEFGFLKEIMVSPVDRVSIILGRVAGGLTTSLFQGLVIMLISIFLGFKLLSINGVITAIIFMVLISATFIGIGLIFASIVGEMQGFNMIVNLFIFPLFFLSGALYPVDNFPEFVKVITYINPLTYGVSAMRAALLTINPIILTNNFVILVITSISAVLLGAYLFEKKDNI